MGSPWVVKVILQKIALSLVYVKWRSKKYVTWHIYSWASSHLHSSMWCSTLFCFHTTKAWCTGHFLEQRQILRCIYQWGVWDFPFSWICFFGDFFTDSTMVDHHIFTTIWELNIFCPSTKQANPSFVLARFSNGGSWILRIWIWKFEILGSQIYTEHLVMNYPPWNLYRTWKWMVGSLFSF